MVHDPANPFSDFESDFKNTDKADPAATPGRVPPETYKFVLTQQEIDGVLKDHEVFVANSGTKGFKLFCEILEPESVPNPKTNEPHVTKGVVLEHVFWITQKNLPYVKRDLATILERDDFTLGELVSIPWAGRTFEGVVKDETRDGYTKSRIAFINPWVPPKADEKAKGSTAGQKPQSGQKAADPKAGTPAKGGAAKPQGQAAKASANKDNDF